MIFWLNAQLPPSLSQWLTDTFGVNALALRDLNLREAQDIDIFTAAKTNGLGTVIITKDRDFVDLVISQGVPPQILWLTCGNISNRDLKRIFISAFPEALTLLEQGEPIVEIGRA
ncbi:MAG: hypothetical protein F6J86_34060 [Symploca sp. SIO1B1]|nr:hypothetical protein [Symploca sp. SIO2D2]NER21926.1 hypothetical protein [Symploca sp. SIO1C2]NER49268.1 hypothetical protein [Symploca sp. SIO1A3]NER98795.1 hypothetical protein [Symploca sp. SIO1B1]